MRLAYLSPDVARGLGGAGGWADKIRGVCAGGVSRHGLEWGGVGWCWWMELVVGGKVRGWGWTVSGFFFQKKGTEGRGLGG